MAERPEETQTELDISSEPISPASAMAIGMHKGRKGPAPDPKFEAFLDKQSRLIDLQTEHLHEQRQVILLRLRLGAWKDRVTLALQGLTALVGVAIAAAIAVMAWQAHEDHGLTIAAFAVPPDLAQRGLTGQVVAARVLDRLSKLQAQTVSARPASTYANDWGDDIKVEIPETGVSIGELNRYLRQWLGSETRVTGEVVRTSTGLQVTARAGGASGQTVEGPESDVDGLITQAAEAIYAETQPYRYAVYLASEKKTNQALAAYGHLADDSFADPKDRAWAYTGWATLLLTRNDPHGALARATEAIKLDPMIDPAYPIRGLADSQLGRRADALASTRAELRMLDGGGAEGISRQEARLKRDFSSSGIATYSGDYTPALKALQRMPEAVSFEGAGTYSFHFALIEDLAALHEGFEARRLLAAGSPPSPAVSEDMAWTRDDWSTALSMTDQQIASSGSVPALQAERARILTRLGLIAQAQTAIAPTPLDCTDCLVARGEIAARTGDRKGADHWFREVVRQAQVPQEYLSWGRSLLILGDPDAAIVELNEAHKLGPHFADPLEVWGEALMAKRDYAGAIKKFAAANKEAPKWGRNHLRWGEALMLSGRYAQARAQYRIANGLDLSVGDRAALNVLLARTATGPLHG